jgi:integrase
VAKVRKRTWTTKKGTQTAWLVDYRDQDGKRRFQQFEKKKEADNYLIQAAGEVKRGTHTPMSTSITVAEAAEIWIARGKAKGHERATLRNYRDHIDRHINPLIGSVKLARLTTPMVATFRDRLEEKYTPSQARRVLVCLKGILREAMERGLVAQNVALPVKVEMKSRDRRKLQIGRDIPSKEEIKVILDNARARWRPLFVTAVFTGMRASELRGLTWVDVDFDKKVLHVRQRANIWGEMGMPKSHAGQRTIPMSPMVVNALKEWRLACPKGKLNLVFPNGAGNVELHSNISHRGFAEIQRKIGMVDDTGKHKYGVHALRHFCASWLIDQAFAPKRIQEWLGHASITMTFDRYGHLFPSLEDDHAKLAIGELSIVGG